MIERQRGRGGAARIAFGHLFHRNKNIVVRVAALLADSGHAGNRFAAAAEIRAFAREVHPRFIAFRRDDGLIHGAVAIIDRSNLILRAGSITLRAQITRRLAEWTFDDSLVRDQHSFDYDLGIGGNQEVLSKSFRRNETQGFAQVTADDVVLANFKRSAIASAHMIGRVMAEHRGDRHFFIARLVVAVLITMLTIFCCHKPSPRHAARIVSPATLSRQVE